MIHVGGDSRPHGESSRLVQHRFVLGSEPNPLAESRTSTTPLVAVHSTANSTGAISLATTVTVREGGPSTAQFDARPVSSIVNFPG